MTETAKPHIGRKVERIRTLRGMKQETLAAALGITQSAISRLEQSEEVDDERLQKVAEALGVTVDTIKHFNEDAVVNSIQNNYDNASSVVNAVNAINNTFNPLEKVTELYERLLKEKEEVIKMQREMLEMRKK